MAESTNDLLGPVHRRHLTVTAATAAAFAVLISYGFALLHLNGVLRTGLPADVLVYETLAHSMFDGLVPYLDFPFEHLPVSAVPIAVIGFASRTTGVTMMLLWPLAMALLFIATALRVDRLQPEDPPGLRFVVVSFPLLPLVLFRLEPWIEFLAVGAMLAFLLGHTARGAILTILGALGKGWPIVLALLPWKLGQRKAALVAAAVSTVLLALVASLDGFQSGREFDGIHTETLAGSLVLLFRHLSGAALGTVPAAGALYVTVPDFTIVVNAIPGVILIVLGFIACIRLPLSSTLSSIGVIILGIMLASPLASTQFIFWIAPFVALLALVPRAWYVAAGVFAFASIAWFDPYSLLWTLEVIARNVALVVLGVLWIASLTRSVRATTEQALP